jgi:hypothetical protein
MAGMNCSVEFGNVMPLVGITETIAVEKSTYKLVLAYFPYLYIYKSETG